MTFTTFSQVESPDLVFNLRSRSLSGSGKQTSETNLYFCLSLKKKQLYETQMQTRLGRAVILVENYDDALRFYEENFLWKKLFDTTAPNGQRYLHIAFLKMMKLGSGF